MHRFPSICLISLTLLASTSLLGAAETTPVEPPKPATAAAPVPFVGVRFDANSIALDQEPGMPIQEVVVGSTAQQLGLEAGDRLLTINGKAIEKPEEISALLAGAKVGDPITIESLHGGKHTVAKGTLSERPKPAALAKEVERLNQKLAEVKELADAQKREPSLAEILQQLKDIETGLPRAVAAFKKQYPNGDFDIRIQVVITSDRTAANPIELSNLPAGGAAKPGKSADGKDQEGKTPVTKPDAAPTPAPATAPAPAPAPMPTTK